MENNNPNEQLGGVVNAWADMQKRMWGDWAAMLQNMPGLGEGNPAAAAKKGLEAASKGGSEAARALMDKITDRKSVV